MQTDSIKQQATQPAPALPEELDAVVQKLRKHAGVFEEFDNYPECAKNMQAAARFLEYQNARIAELETLINTPQTEDFFAAVRIEAAHQQDRWGSDQDAGKSPMDWVFLLGYLGGKAVEAFSKGDRALALHRIIASAAALLNWHRNATGTMTRMRPGFADPEGKV